MMNDTLAIKEARTEHDVHPLIRNRFSPRAFTDDAVSETDLLALFEAAAWAPSAMNEQPWRFRYAMKGEPGFQALRDTLSSGNMPWAPNAAAIVAISGMKHHARNGAVNHTTAFDTGMATANLLVQATAMNLHGHLLGGFDHAAASALLGINNDQEELICLLVIGHLGPADALGEPYLTRERTPRVRKPLVEIAQRIR